jgi:Protein of unknown function (DUF2630)
MTSDASISDHIEQLVAEEHALRARHEDGSGLTPEEQARMDEITVELDRYWDLLRQRRAHEEFDEDPDLADLRPAGEVENYEQ